MKTFLEWLKEQEDREDVVGTLSKDSLADPAWTGDDPTSLKKHIYSVVTIKFQPEVLLWFSETVDEWYEYVDSQEKKS